MSSLSILAVPALAASGAGTAVASPNTVNQANGRNAVGVIASPGGAFVGTVKLQGSDDNTTWADLTTAQAMAGSGGVVFASFAAKPYYRLNNTAFTSGSVSATIIS